MDADVKERQYDVAVVGSGAAGLCAAVIAALDGASVVLIERTGLIGGTSALSGGTVWVPLSAPGRAINPEDDRERVSAFLDGAVGGHGDRAMREAFLDAGPGVIARLEAETRVAFRPCPRHPDYEWAPPHATLNGRAIEPVPFDTRPMGRLREAIRPPIPEFTILGGMNIDRTDIPQLLARWRSPSAMMHTLRIVARYGRDRLRHGRHTRLVMGNALVARLLASAADLGVEIRRDTSVAEIISDAGRVTGLALDGPGGAERIAVRGGVILATGGFGRDPRRRAAHLPAALGPDSPAAPGHTAELHPMAEALGAHYGTGGAQNAFWAPCSIRTRRDGSRAVFPHFVLDRAKPGTVCVDARGRRFVNETLSYHRFGQAMLEGGSDTAHGWIVADAAAIRRYGLGMVRPGGDRLGPYLSDGYLIRADNIAELAARIGAEPATLEESVAQINAAARSGTDTALGRGTTPYQRHNGDPAVEPNPTLGPIATAPFYAVRLQPADIGTALGFRADVSARLLRADGTVIEGLYAAGNDMQSIMGGTYPGPGITLGPALVFGAIAGGHAAARAARTSKETSHAAA